MNIKIVFLAGPFTGDGSLLAKQKNIEVAKTYVLLLLREKISYYSPHLNVCETSLRFPNITSEQMTSVHKPFLYVCHILAVMPGWEDSPGTKEEIDIAEKLGIPIVYLKDGDIDNLVKEYFS